MATINPRINITVPQEVADILERKAKQDRLPLSKVALSLLLEAMERDEDIYWLEHAKKRESDNKKWLSHDDAWK
jgi:hypothetical protein